MRYKGANYKHTKGVQQVILNTFISTYDSGIHYVSLYDFSKSLNDQRHVVALGTRAGTIQ